jgi:thioredoxin 1
MMAGENTLHFDESNFEAEVLQSDVPVMVDFWAEWCGPCLMVAPTIDALADEYQGKAKIGKCDVDKAPNLAAKFGVQNIPTVLLFKGGEPIQRVVGAKNKKDYASLIDDAVSGASNV